MNDIIKIIKSVEDSGVLIDGVTETVKHETKKQEGGFLSDLKQFSHFIRATSNFLVVKGIIGKVEEGLEEPEEDIWIKNFSAAQFFKQHQDY